MAWLEAHKISGRILKNVSFSLNHGECLALFGPSGSGKTTLLNMIAGNIAYHGSFLLKNQSIDHLKPWQRPFRYLNQHLYLFPHLTIDQNLRLAQYAAGLKQNSQKRKFLLEQFEISHLAQRNPKNISGGEQQRAAFARSLIGEPEILLLDEPFSNLGWSLRERLWNIFIKIQKEYLFSTILVTHEPKDVDALAQHCLYLHEGETYKEI